MHYSITLWIVLTYFFYKNNSEANLIISTKATGISMLWSC